MPLTERQDLDEWSFWRLVGFAAGILVVGAIAAFLVGPYALTPTKSGSSVAVRSISQALQGKHKDCLLYQANGLAVVRCNKYSKVLPNSS